MVDLDLLSCFPKNGQESLEGRVGIKLSKLPQWRRERGKTAQEKWGRRPLFIGATKVAVGGEKPPQPDSPAWGRRAARLGRPGIWSVKEAANKPAAKLAWEPGLGRQRASWAGLQPEGAGLDPGLGRPGSEGAPPVRAGLGAGLGPGQPGRSAIFFFFLFKFLSKKCSERETL